MPHNDQINYNVKVRLDLEDQTDASVIYNAANKKFELGTGTGITITNPDQNNILTADGTTSNIIGEDYFRYVNGGSEGTNLGKVAIGTYDSLTPYLPLDVCRDVTPATTNNFPQALFYSNNSNSSHNIGLKVGLQRIPREVGGTTNHVLGGALGMADKSGDPETDIYIGNFNSLGGSATFNQNAVFGHNVTFGLGYRERGAIPFDETPTIVKVNNSYLTSTFTVGADITQTGEAGGKNQVAQITNYNTSKTQNNVALEIRLAAYEGQYHPSQGGWSQGANNAKFISFKRRKSNAEAIQPQYSSTPPWIECGKIVLEGAIDDDFPQTSYISTSDKRFKQNVKPLSLGLDELLKIQPSEYNWIGSPVIDTGFLAQDLYKIYPKAVYKPENPDNLEDVWGVDYGKLTPLIVKAIQDQQKIIEELKEKIDNLEKQNK